MTQIYGKVNDIEDIRRINCLIRNELLVTDDPSQLTDLKKRADYLCTLTYSPFWKKHFSHQIDQVRKIACEENRVTVQLANFIAKHHDWNKHYSPWGKDKVKMDEALKEIPEEVIQEVFSGTINLKAELDTLDQIRQMYCEIRKGMVVVENSAQLVKLKRAADLTQALIHLPDFTCRFDDKYEDIDNMVREEDKRTVALATLIAEVMEWNISFECWAGEDIGDDENIETYLNRIEKEEKKSDQFIPTETKYKQGKILWLVYLSPKHGRRYAKRIYFPGSAKDIAMNGPDNFKNRFGRQSWGVNITYKSRISEREIHRYGKIIHLPETWITRNKVIPLPKNAEEIKLQEERPPQAMMIA